jgi:diguanylate cyclase (GGDEF)-like protein
MPKERPCVLIVDPSEADCLQACSILSLLNYEALAAHSGEEALALVANSPIDAMLICLEVPGGGFALSTQLRALPVLEDVPLAFSTAAEYDFSLLMEAQFYTGLFLHRKPLVDSELLAQASTMVRIKQLQDELKERMSELDKIASIDVLTGLYNRRFFYLRLEEELARAGRSGTPLCLAFLDIDHFKQFNDAHGHQAGDAVLQQTARIMSHMLRKNDVLGRIGGEEFMILLPDTDGKGGARLAERMRQRIESAVITYGELELPITVSIGVFYSADPVMLGVDELVQRADTAMYEAKQAGRNRIVYHAHYKAEAVTAAVRPGSS